MNSTLFHCHRMSVEETLSWPAHTPSRHHIKISWQIKILAQEARSATQLEKENRTRLHTDNEVQLQKRWYRSSLNKYFLETSSIIFEWINADTYGRTTFYKQKWNRGSTLRKQVNLLQLFAVAATGNTALLQAHGFMPFFYIAYPDKFDTSIVVKRIKYLTKHWIWLWSLARLQWLGLFASWHPCVASFSRHNDPTRAFISVWHYPLWRTKFTWKWFLFSVDLLGNCM